MDQMPTFRRPISYASAANASGVIAGFMNGVYAWMSVGLLLTALVAWVTAHNQAMLQMVQSSFLILILAELGLVIALSAAIHKLSATVATLVFAVYASLNGLTLSGVFLAYELPTIGGAFMITAGMFAAMSVVGMTTRKDLSGLGGLCFMALIGLILASIVNIFFASEMLYWLVTYAGVLIFVGLTAYDTQKLKAIALQTADDPAMAGRMAIYGSLSLYLDFINLMLFILRILGGKRR